MFTTPCGTSAGGDLAFATVTADAAGGSWPGEVTVTLATDRACIQVCPLPGTPGLCGGGPASVKATGGYGSRVSLDGISWRVR